MRTIVVAEAMHRAPAFGFDSAREARAFGDWLTVNFENIKAEAEASTHVDRLNRRLGLIRQEMDGLRPRSGSGSSCRR